MIIKTITAVDGINVVDFGSSANRFYWFQNLGTTTVHVSANADIVAGADGVAEIAAGGVACIETTEGKVYVLGAGKVQINNTGDKFCPVFKKAPVGGGGGEVNHTVKWQYAVLNTNGFLDNALTATNTDGCKLAKNFSDARTDGLALYKSYSGYNITHSDAIDFTPYNKIIIHGATVANTGILTTVAYARVSNEELTAIDQQWVQINSSIGIDVAEFTAEIDCTGVVGEQNLYLGVTHGTETSSYTSYVHIYDITFL